MTRDDIIKLAREAGAMFDHMTWVERDLAPVFERFAAKVAAVEREKVAHWMIQRSYATGHGDTTEDLLSELEWQIKESEREACASFIKNWEYAKKCASCDQPTPDQYAAAIRARGET